MDTWIFKVTIDGQTKIFTDPQEAAEGLACLLARTKGADVLILLDILRNVDTWVVTATEPLGYSQMII